MCVAGKIVSTYIIPECISGRVFHGGSLYKAKTYIKYSLDFLHPAEAFEAVDWLADLVEHHNFLNTDILQER